MSVGDTTPKQEVGFQMRGSSPWCERCNRPVEQHSVETPIVAHRLPFSAAFGARYTGEKIIRIECHGERFIWSSWHGVTFRETD